MMNRLFPIIFSACLVYSLQATTPKPSTLQEQAEFLAGLPLPGRSSLAPLQKTRQYRDYQRHLQEQWAFCRSVRFEAMQRWGREHLVHDPEARGILRYLFGGPDFLNAYAFFPDERVMVLGGLEPVGEIPPPEALDATTLDMALRSLHEALRTSLFCGYFITSEMKPQLIQGSFQGVLPVLFTELALTGNIIESAQMVSPFGSPGVQIIYRRPGAVAQTLYYFKADLSNGSDCKRFLTWLEEFGSGATYLKAASYLLPLDSFSQTRNFLLSTSTLILQDDSGIPFRRFVPGEWNVELYGTYTEPLEIFKLHRETELNSAYQGNCFKGPLPFGAGYHVNASDANLLLATRNQKREAPVAPSSSITLLPAISTPVRKGTPIPVRKAIPVNTPKNKLAAGTATSPRTNSMPVVVPLAKQNTGPAPSYQESPCRDGQLLNIQIPEDIDPTVTAKTPETLGADLKQKPLGSPQCSPSELLSPSATSTIQGPTPAENTQEGQGEVRESPPEPSLNPLLEGTTVPGVLPEPESADSTRNPGSELGETVPIQSSTQTEATSEPLGSSSPQTAPSPESSEVQKGSVSGAAVYTEVSPLTNDDVIPTGHATNSTMYLAPQLEPKDAAGEVVPTTKLNTVSPAADKNEAPSPSAQSSEIGQ